MPAEIIVHIKTSAGEFDSDPIILRPNEYQGFVHFEFPDEYNSFIKLKESNIRKILLAHCTENDEKTIVYDIFTEDLSIDALFAEINKSQKKRAKSYLPLTDLRKEETLRFNVWTKRKTSAEVAIKHTGGQTRRNSRKKSTR